MNYVDELLPDMLLQAPDVSDVALRRALQLAAQDMFREADIWVHEFQFSLFEGIDQYQLPIPTGTRIARVEWVQIDKRDLKPLDLEDIAEGREKGYHITNDEPHLLLVTEHVERVDGRASVRLYPTPATTELPDWLVHDFRTAIVNSGLARIYGAPGSPWFDPNLATLLVSQVGQQVLKGKRLVDNRKRGKNRTVRYGGY